MYQAIGLQALLTAIRTEGGATNLVLLGGIQYANNIGQWLQYAPVDPLTPGNVGAAWHVYNFNACVSSTCWDVAPAAVAAAAPLVATEIGENDCADGAYLEALMQWLDAHGGGYLAWSWNAYGACVAQPPSMQGGNPWSLITDYASGIPNGGFAQGFHDHLIAIVQTN